jgi:NADH:ubiquinone oxidoreductase subunit 5 (subunit L)/multisubunit Na+/H+ antiporter MnhA subunit
MLILVILFPLLGFLSGSIFGRYIGLGVSYITTLFTFSSFILSFILLCNIIKSGNVYILNLTQ